jgi:hypothetical protein
MAAAGRNVTSRSLSDMSLTKRVTTNACDTGCKLRYFSQRATSLTVPSYLGPVVTCTNGLSSSSVPPTSSDCAALASAINALAKSELSAPPCNFNNPACEFLVGHIMSRSDLLDLFTQAPIFLLLLAMKGNIPWVLALQVSLI